MKRELGKLARLVAVEPIGVEGYTMAHYTFEKCHHTEQRLYAPGRMPRKTRKVRCYECERFRRLCGV